MNWEAIGAVAELVGGVAVVVTLIYLSLQLRQNTKTTRQAILRNQTDRYIANCHFMAGGSGIMDIYLRAMEDPDSVNREEWWRFGTYMYGMFKDYEEMFFLKSEDDFAAHRWEDSQTNIKFYLHPPGGRKWWNSNGKHLMSSTFRDFVDQLIGAGPTRSVTEQQYSTP